MKVRLVNVVLCLHCVLVRRSLNGVCLVVSSLGSRFTRKSIRLVVYAFVTRSRSLRLARWGPI